MSNEKFKLVYERVRDNGQTLQTDIAKINQIELRNFKLIHKKSYVLQHKVIKID